MTQQPARICILGGGFGGLYTALRLSQLPWEPLQKPEIVLVDQRDRFVFLPLLYELLTGELQTWEVAPPFSELLATTGIQFRQTAVTGIDPEAQRVYLADEQVLPYDRLVLALGGETPLTMAPGTAEHAIAFRTIDDVYRLQERLRVLEASPADRIRVAVVGGGYSGVELACKLADRLGDRGRVRLVELSDQILRTSPEYNRETATKALEKRGVWVDLETKVASIGAETITLEYKGNVDTLPVDVVMWTVGTQVPDVVKALPLKHNAEGQLVPANAQVAFQQADYAGWNIWASLSDRPLLPFRYQHLGEMLALGNTEATLTGMGVKLDGSAAYIVRRLAYLYRMPTFDHQLRVGLNWVTKPLRDLLAR